ncbi:hypothetical protein GCM10010389_65580 [Streptomyces echinoruber]|uniref:Uncharacterized protein n=1 Tax=Streptomyces echinoruber TaxID=68898 RepID=A0A918S2C8_9ACTN|nr:hypothetical protein GCM10010389_65580 [Streptomyces echinoruber]
MSATPSTPGAPGVPDAPSTPDAPDAPDTRAAGSARAVRAPNLTVIHLPAEYPPRLHTPGPGPSPNPYEPPTRTPYDHGLTGGNSAGTRRR